jgi:ACR3 family arsenite efflux pump ArsB
MSEEYRSAYRALRLKDLMQAFLPDIKNMAIILCIFTVVVTFCSDKATTLVFAAATAIAGIAYLVVRFLAGVFSRKIEQLGFSEVELEASLVSVERR